MKLVIKESIAQAKVYKPNARLRNFLDHVY